MTKIKANRHTIEISNPDKEIFPGEGITKSGLVDFYRKISKHILPHLADRPLTMHRYPNGINGKSFYQKDEPDYFPGWIDTAKVELREKGEQDFVVCNNEATLLYLANQASITPHIWLSKTEKPEYPDRLIFDLDPPEGDFGIVQDGARDLKKFFDELEMKSFVMTTGSKGMHVVIPLDGKSKFDESRDFAKAVAEKLAKKNPEKYTIETRKNKRRGRLFIDYLRNAYGQTAVAPYAMRARKGAPVATPLEWSEATSSKTGPQTFHHGNIFRRLSQKKDPWHDIGNYSYNIGESTKKLNEHNSTNL